MKMMPRRVLLTTMSIPCFALIISVNGFSLSNQRRSSHYAATTSSSDAPVVRKQLTEFTTPLQQVYIEDTDAYGVMYNANYLRAYDRALHMTGYYHQSNDDDDDSTNRAPLPVLQHDGWSITAVDQLKFKASPDLGGSFVITGVLQQESSSEMQEVWDMTMQSPDGEIIYNTAEGVQIARPPSEQDVDALRASDHSWLPRPKPLSSKSSTGITASTRDVFATYRDEFDPHLTTHLPLNKVLNLFERARSNYIGGPSSLRRLQQEDGILYVVTGVHDCSLVDYDAITDGNTILRPGDEVTIETDFVCKRQGMVIECLHTAKLPGETRIIAQGVVTLMALSEQTRRPTSKLPTWVMDHLGISN